MLIAHDLKVVFLGVPRTSSTATHTALKQISSKFDYFGKHGMNIPEQYRHYFTFACVRNPYAREYSHYLYRHTTPNNALNKWAKNWSFDEYVRWNVDHTARPTDFRDKPQSTHLDGIRLDALLRFEDLPEAFYTLPFVPKKFKWPVMLKRLGGKPWQPHYTKETADLVYNWCAKDFDVYNYDKDSWKQ